MSQILRGSSGGGGGTLVTLSGSSGGLVSPTGGGNIKLLGSTNITTVGTPGSNQIVYNLVDSPTCAGTITGLALKTSTATAHLNLSGATISTEGSDANIALNFTSKGDADINFTTATGYGIVFDGVTTGWASSQYHTIQKTTQSTDATPVIIHSIPLGNSLMITVKALINGIQDDYSDVVGGEILVTAYRSAVGDIALVGSPIISVNYSNPVDTSDIDAVINVGTQSLDIRCIGVAAQNWNWVGTISFMQTVSNA